ncbi:MAG: sigma-70 family RNA polymerase sigma factor [bacterium]
MLFQKEKLNGNDFSKLFAVYQPKVFDFVLKRVTSKEVAEDLTSDIFEKILKSIHDFQWQGITVSAWIFKIARNRIIDYYRKNNSTKNNVSIEDVANFVVSSAPNVEVEMMADDEEKALYDALRELGSNDQYLIYYKFFEGLSNKDIADITGMTETNIGTRLHRIRKKIADIISLKTNQK